MTDGTDLGTDLAQMALIWVGDGGEQKIGMLL